jgi:activator of 2-hydroxyglutaryl-CoA dehydratase
LLLIDAGTSYIKILDTKKNKLDIFTLNSTQKLKELRPQIVTGHNSGLFPKAENINELVALAKGASVIINKGSFTVLDIGSRDMKLVRFIDNKFDNCEWNTSCGAMIGFTIDLMCKYFSKNPKELPLTNKKFDITCGLLGITKFFDNISSKMSVEEGLSALINGLAKFAWQFAGEPSDVYLSGGLSENPVFIKALRKLCPELKPLGRTVLLEGLKSFAQKEGDLSERIINRNTSY